MAPRNSSISAGSNTPASPRNKRGTGDGRLRCILTTCLECWKLFTKLWAWDGHSRLKGAFAAGTENFAGFCSGEVPSWTDREKSLSGTERIPISKNENVRKMPSAQVKKVSV